jgi:hypothetical protein
MSVVHCKREAYDVYIGRGRDPRGGEPGEWGNPFSHRPSRVAGIVVVDSVSEAIERYRRFLWEEIGSGRLPLARLAALHGKRLGCWCAPGPCHGEVLEAAAMWALTEQARRLQRRVAEISARARRRSGIC